MNHLTLPDSDNFTAEEFMNIRIVSEYMQIAYTPGVASAKTVKHLCGEPNHFIAPTTFPDVHTVENYAEAHGKLMEEINDLHFVSYDVMFAQDDRVCLRYTAQGTHLGKAHEGLPPTGRKARWSAVGLFKLKDGKIVEFYKDWNKLAMWEQLGWPLKECLSYAKSPVTEWAKDTIAHLRGGTGADQAQKSFSG